MMIIKLYLQIKKGINRHFDMVCIHDQFSKAINKDVHSKSIWKYLETLYDMDALHENEDEHFVNEEQEFNLPAEFDKLKEEKETSAKSMSASKNKALDTVGQRKNKNKK